MRRALISIHLWLGLTIGLFWALQGLTGAMLVFHREVDRLTGPRVVAGAMASLDTIAATDDRITMIGIADGRADLLAVSYADTAGTPRTRLVEAATGEVVGAREADPATPFSGSASRWLYLLHESLLLHDRGETLVGISGLVLLSAALTGVWIGWPRRGSWRGAFAPGKWRTTRIRLYGWHRAVGLPASIGLLITVPCGIWMIFAAELRPALAGIVPHRQAFAPAPVGALVVNITPQVAFERAATIFPDAGFVRLTMPTPAAPAYFIRLRQPDETRVWSGVTSVAIDPASGRVLDIYDPTTAPLSNRLADAAFSVHSAEIAGLPGRILLMMLGLALPTLYVTGVLAWWRKRSARAANVKSAPPFPFVSSEVETRCAASTSLDFARDERV